MSEISTYEEALTRLQTVLLQLPSYDDLKETVESRDEVLQKFGRVFSREHLAELTKHEFHSFLLVENNKHWSGLHRPSPKMTSDMDALRDALDLLLYGDEPIERRLTEAVSNVTGMGRAIATALLLVVHPEEYGVWNSTSEAGLKFLNLWPRFRRGASLGERYAEINDVLKELALELDTDLWTLDSLWWKVEEPEFQEEGASQAIATGELGYAAGGPQVGISGARPGEVGVHAFRLERHLQDFLWNNWEKTDLGKEWELYTEEGEPEAGFEYPSGVGRIDLLARHRTENRWLVIELKQSETSDASVGQVLRYMGWIKQELAEPGDEVQGLIIAQDVDEKLCYAASVIPEIELQRYEVDFSLLPVEKLRRSSL